MRMPGTAVSIGLNSPRTFSGASGLGSNVSMWLGPPAIQSRMHALGRGPSGACAASRPSQPESVAPAAAATNPRRVRSGDIVLPAPAGPRSMVQGELARHHQGPGQLSTGRVHRIGPGDVVPE